MQDLKQDNTLDDFYDKDQKILNQEEMGYKENSREIANPDQKNIEPAIIINEYASPQDSSLSSLSSLSATSSDDNKIKNEPASDDEKTIINLSSNQLLELAREAEQQAYKATMIAKEASQTAQITLHQHHEVKEEAQLQLLEAKLQLAQQAASAADAALEAQNASRDSAAAAICQAEKDLSEALNSLKESQKEAAKVQQIVEDAENSSLEASQKAALATQQAKEEEEKVLACRQALKAAAIIQEKALQKYNHNKNDLEKARLEASQASERLNQISQNALSANLIAKNIIQQLNNKPEEEAKYSAKAKKEHDFLNETEEANQTNSFLHGLWTICKLAILALAIALLLRTYVFEITKVDGSSMSPTLETGDNLLTSKISYLIDHPQRGDIVIIEAPDKNNIFYVKRIVGLPNDKITIKNGQVYINEQLLSEDYLNDIYTTGEINTIVEENGYFVLGDNRASSHDSRSNSVGNIMEDDIIGKAILRLYPMDRFGKLE